MPPLPLTIDRLHGRNGADPPQDLPEDMAQEVLNMDFFDGSLGRKRPGAADVTLNGVSAAGRFDSLGRYLPSDDETASELHAADSGALTTMQRLAAGTTWATYTLANAIQANSTDVDMVSFDGKLYQAYNSAVNRLHVYPSAGGTHREVGLPTPAAPTVSEAAGAVTDNRKYAVCWTRQDSGRTTIRSNIGTLTGVRTLTAEDATITQPTVPSEGETHWELYAYSDDDDYALGYLIATTVIATTTAVDANTTLSGNAPPESGANTPPPSAKYLLTDGTHLIGAGAWETSAGTSIFPSTRMVWWTPAIGTSADPIDSERISDTTDIKSYLFVDAGITGMGGPLNGMIYAFGYRHVWKLVPTGEAASAFQRITVRDDIGCIRHKTIVIGEDDQGRATLYWLSHIGPYRAGASGVQYIGRDIEDRWAQVNLDATSVVAFSLFVPTWHAVLFWVATGANNDPNEILYFDCRAGRFMDIGKVNGVHYGWARWTGRISEARCGILFATTLGASMSREISPYIGRTGTGISAPTLWRMDSGTTDASTTYQAYTKTKDYTLGPAQYHSMQHDAYVIAETSSGVTITLTTQRDFGKESTTATAVLTADASETRTIKKFEGAAIGEAAHVNFQIGDGSAADNSWVLDSLIVPLTKDDRV